MPFNQAMIDNMTIEELERYSIFDQDCFYAMASRVSELGERVLQQHEQLSDLSDRMAEAQKDTRMVRERGVDALKEMKPLLKSLSDAFKALEAITD